MDETNTGKSACNFRPNLGAAELGKRYRESIAHSELLHVWVTYRGRSRECLFPVPVWLTDATWLVQKPEKLRWKQGNPDARNGEGQDISLQIPCFAGKPVARHSEPRSDGAKAGESVSPMTAPSARIPKIAEIEIAPDGIASGNPLWSSG